MTKDIIGLLHQPNYFFC